MKTNTKALVVVLFVGLAMAIVGSIFMGIAPGDFNLIPLGMTLRDIGYITFALSGIVLTGLSVASAVSGEQKKHEKKD